MIWLTIINIMMIFFVYGVVIPELYFVDYRLTTCLALIITIFYPIAQIYLFLFMEKYWPRKNGVKGGKKK